MKTVFITCFTGLISRNILSTDAFRLLRERSELRIVIITLDATAEVLRKEYGGPNVIVESVPVMPLRLPDTIWWALATHLLPTCTRELQRRARLARDDNYIRAAFSRLLGFLGRFRVVRGAFRSLAWPLIRTGEFAPLFDRYEPSLLFSTDVYTASDVKCMRLARARGVATVGMVRSWDNVTSKTLLVVIPPFLIAPSEAVRRDLLRYCDVPAERIFVSGVPHYDRYRAAGRTPREEFFSRFGLDPARPLILFTPPSDIYLRGDPVAPVVLESLRNIPAQILVRTSLVGRVELGNATLPPNAVLDEPGVSPDFTKAHLSPEADRHLADSIFSSDVVITWASTVIIDAIVFGKPVVLVGFDANPRQDAESIRQYYGYNHQRRIIELGGVRLAKSPTELAALVQAYLTNPRLDASGRAATIKEYCGDLDGKAGERLGRYLLERISAIR